MDWFLDFGSEVVWLFNETAFFLLVGFLLAGLLRSAVSASRVLRHLKGNDTKAVTVASLAGVPLPLCSCSVLPVAASLRKQGASRGATASFLISTPETGVDSIATSYALLDPILTVVRPVAAFVTAVVTGVCVNWFGRADDAAAERSGGEGDAGPDVDCEHPHEHAHAHAHDHEAEAEELVGGSGDAGARRSRLAPYRYAFGELLDELAPYLVIGFLLSGLIAMVVPSSWFANPVLGGFGGMLLMLGVGLPMYVCATASTPVAAALLMKGLNPGAAVVFLLVGPATNIGAIVALRHYLGKRSLKIYLTCIVVVSLAIGLAVDAFYLGQGIEVSAVVGKGASFVPAELKALCSVLLLGLMIRSTAKTRFYREWGDRVRRVCRPLGFDPLGRRARIAGIAALLVLYLSSGVSVLGPGKTGWVLAFGRVEREVTEPGLVFHWPAPVGRLASVDREQIRRVTPGEVDDPEPTGVGERAPGRWYPSRSRLAEQEAEVVDADSNVLVIRSTVLYTVEDSRRFGFDLADPDRLVEANADWALRRVAASMHTDDLLVGRLEAIQRRVGELVQAELDRLDAGIRVETVQILFVHAPEAVHMAFRDIASAQEERETKIHTAYRDARVEVIRAEWEAYRERRDAEALATLSVASERGRADAWRMLVEAWRESSGVTRSRLRFDALESMLRASPLRLNLTGGEIDLEFWFDERGGGNEPLPVPGRATGAPARDEH